MAIRATTATPFANRPGSVRLRLFTDEVPAKEQDVKSRPYILTQRWHNITYRPGQLKQRLWGSATLLLILRSGRTICRERRVKYNEGDSTSQTLNNQRRGCGGGDTGGKYKQKSYSLCRKSSLKCRRTPSL